MNSNKDRHAVDIARNAILAASTLLTALQANLNLNLVPFGQAPVVAGKIREFTPFYILERSHFEVVAFYLTTGFSNSLLRTRRTDIR